MVLFSLIGRQLTFLLFSSSFLTLNFHSQNFKATLEFVFLSELVLVLSIDILFELIYRIEIFISQMWFTFL